MFNEDIKVLRRLIPLLKGYRKKILALLICIIVSTALSFALPLINKQLVDNGLQKNNINIVIKFALFSLFLNLIIQAINTLASRYESYLNTMFPYNLSKAALKKTLKLPIQYINSTNYTEIMNNLNLDINNISRILDRTSFFLIMQLFRMIAGMIGLVLISWKLTLLIVFVTPIRLVIVKNLAKRRRILFEGYMDSVRKSSFWYGDTLAGIKEIKLLGIERIKIGEFIKRRRPIIKTDIKMLFTDKLNDLSEGTLLPVITCLIYIIGSYMLINGSLSLGGLFAFITYSMHVTGPISAILDIGYSYSSIIPSAKRFLKFLDVESEETESGKRRINYNLDFLNIQYDNVKFTYDNKITVLKNINFEIKQGEKIAIVGSNGSGKTTLTNLLLRFYKPTEGKILLNGIDINEFRLSDYRKIISVVNQDFYLFNTTIRNNIGIRGKSKHHEIHKAALESGAFSFISKMPQKYDSIVGQNGMQLSGGERQKLALARALVNNSKIIILDEVTSNIDIETEKMINQFIATKLKNKTVLVISHKPGILKYMDKIIILEKGTIKAIGTYKELCSKNDLSQYLSEVFVDSELRA